MKRIISTLIATLFCCILFTGCGNPPTKEQAQSFAVYSFSGENEQFKISNGVVVLTSTKEILYGGNLKINQEKFTDITAYSMEFYLLSDGKKEILLSNAATDKTGSTIDIYGEIGKISRDVISNITADHLENNLYFELKTTNSKGEKNKYQLKMDVIDITKKNDTN